jgi:hypothetical protein
MPRQRLASVENTFINGLITEATGLNFPEKACTEADNVVFDETGKVYRRLGVDLEEEFDTEVVERDDLAMTSYVWKNVAGDANLTLLVNQIGGTLYFYDTTSFANISFGIIDNEIDLTTHIPMGGPSPVRKECQFASGHGVLFVYHPTLEPFYVEYDADTREVSDTEIDIRVRDFEGEDDGLDVDQRPTSTFAGIGAKHHYNLRNQGWTDANITAWDTARTDLPSSVDVMWYFKNADDEFDASTVSNIMAGNSHAPTGHYVMNVFDQDRTTVSSIAGLTTTTTGFRRVSTGAFFAGRVWYSGIDAQKFKGHLYFSQVIENFRQFGECLQVNDPTSENLFDLLPTDGGKIDIADAGTIFKIIPVQSSLVVFASNGVWAITGSTGLGFVANDYVIQKIAEIPTISASSIVVIAGFPAWWNYDGIYSLQGGANGELQVQSLTDAKIKTLFQGIPDTSKLFARGAYNALEKTVQWVYREEEPVTISDRYNFDRVLQLNLHTGAFSTWTFGEADVTVNSVFVIESVGETVTVLDVVADNGDLVVDSLGNQVVVYEASGLIQARYVYGVSYPDGAGEHHITFANSRDADYVDWASHADGPVDYISYFVTGYKLRGDAQRKFQNNYIYVYVDNVNPGQLKIRGQWDYALSASTNRWSAEQLLTYTDTDYRYRKKRIKIRGHGIALQLRVTSVEGEPFDIIGWSMFDTANVSV